MRWAVRGLGMISTIILARLLVPADFGLVAMAMAVGGALDAVLEPGFNVALITDPNHDRSAYDAAWTWSIVKGLFVALLLILFAPAIAGYFREPRIVAIVYVLAVRSVVSGFQNIGMIDFVKDLRLHRNFMMELGSKLVSFATMVTAAVIFRNYWALIIGMVTQTSARVVLSFLLSDFRHRLSLRGSVGLLRFSSWTLVSNIVGALASHIDAFVIGRLVTARGLGIYGVADEISALP